MSSFTSTQIAPPTDEQVFERASVVLWRRVLNDPNVHPNGTRGQRQNGVDLSGDRGRDIHQPVGIQCKCKGPGKKLTEKEVRAEVAKARTYQPPLKEYFITTTAPDDSVMHELGRRITRELQENGCDMRVYIWGWGTLTNEINRYPDARREFDSTWNPFIEEGITLAVRGAIEQGILLVAEAAQPGTPKSVIRTPPPVEEARFDVLEGFLNKQLNQVRTLLKQGKPRTALTLLEGIHEDLPTDISQLALFRVKVYIGYCHYDLGNDDQAVPALLEAYDHAPKEPKAVAAKAFALLLAARWQETVDFCALELVTHPDNEDLAGYLVQAATNCPGIGNPLDLIPGPALDSRLVQISMIDFRRHRGQKGEWWSAAHEVKKQFPELKIAKRLSAEAFIDQIVSNPDYINTYKLTDADRVCLTQSVEELMTQWNDVKNAEGNLRPEFFGIYANLLLALWYLQDLPRALEIVRQGKGIFRLDQDIAVRSALVTIETREHALFAEILPHLPNSSSSALLKARFYVETGEITELHKLYNTSFDLIPNDEREIISVVIELERLERDRPDDLETQIEAIRQRSSQNARACALIAQCAHRLQLNVLAEQAYRSALTCVTDETDMAIRTMVAQYAELYGDWKTVSDLFDHRVPEDIPSDKLASLARAFANQTPVRQRAVDFFNRLPKPVKNERVYRHCEAVMAFHQNNLGRSESLFRSLLDGCRDLYIYLPLYEILRRADRVHEFVPIIESVDLDALKGSTAEKMSLARILVNLGKQQQGAEYAYGALKEDSSDSAAVQSYITLFLMDHDGELIPQADTVGADCWVQFEDGAGHSIDYLIGGEGDKALALNSPLAAAAVGKRPSDSFEVKIRADDVQRWKVIDCKHKYLHLLHDLMARFRSKFPTANGLKILTMPEGDIQPLLDEIKRTSESRHRRLDYYIKHGLPKHGLPLEMVAAYLKVDPVTLADAVRQIGHDIRTCRGSHEERDNALQLIGQTKDCGVVLDAYTAWTASALDVMDLLKHFFGDIVVPSRAVEALRELRDSLPVGSGPAMSMSWKDGHFYRSSLDSKTASAIRQDIDNQIRRIEKHCRILTTSLPDDAGEFIETLVSRFGPHVLDAAYLARNGHVLVSEDLYFREMVGATLAVKSVWLHPILHRALQDRIIDSTRYSAAVVGLAHLRHTHLYLDPLTLFTVFKNDADPNQSDFKAVAQCIGGAGAAIVSHVRAVGGFLNYIWGENKDADLRTKAATGLLLENLLRFRTGDWRDVLYAVWVFMPAPCRFYIVEWARGHFLPL